MERHPASTNPAGEKADDGAYLALVALIVLAVMLASLAG